jgi:hypothetical protein
LLKRHITYGINNSLKRLIFDAVVSFAAHKEFEVFPVQEDGWAIQEITLSDSMVELRYFIGGQIGVFVHQTSRHGFNLMNAASPFGCWG